MRWLGAQPQAMLQPRTRTRTHFTMPDHASTSELDARSPSLGQGGIVLPGIGEVWLAWSARGLLMLSLPGQAPGEAEAEMVDRGIDPPPVCEVPELYAKPLLA